MSGGVGRKAGAPIGWKDFPMPWKTHTESCREAASFCARVRFELGGRQIAERRVQPFLVVDLFEELADGSARLGQVAVFVAEDLLVLAGFS